ncbi:MAG: hypothetical protein JWP72_1829 [Massilia sp.]|nr:hypothetical protein [Massilia sp.]
MKRYLRSGWLRVLAVLVAALAGTWAVGAVQDKYEVAKMNEKKKTVCVGRMLIDLPEEARVTLYPAWIDGFYIGTVEESADAFARRLAAREAEIQAKPDRFGGKKNMELVREVKTESGLSGKIFVHSRYVTEGTRLNGLDIERYRHEGFALEGHVHGDGISFDIKTDDYDPALIGNLPKLIAQLVGNRTGRIPTEPGFCIDRGYFRDPLIADQNERIEMAATLPSRPDIAINFDTAAGLKPDSQGLLERNDASHARAPLAVNLRFTRLRAAPRTIGGLTGDELVERVVEENFAIIYGFRWETLGTEDNVFVPALSLLMATGRSKEGPIPSSLSQPAALDLWDNISSSIRMRPTHVPKVSVAEPPALGSYAMAGDACIQTGWWQCNGEGNGTKVLGGQRQYIREGERMPQALLLPPQTLWEKVRGLQPSYETTSKTPWRLVDRRSRRRITSDVPLDQAKAAIEAANTVTAAPAGVDAIERASVGAYAMTGNACPASGWWHCQESHALDGTRWFAQGSLLPAATFAVPERVFGKTSGTQKAMQRRGIWQLVRIAQAPEIGASPAEKQSQEDEAGPDSASS